MKKKRIKKINNIILLMQPCINEIQKKTLRSLFYTLIDIIIDNPNYNLIVRNHPDFKFDQLIDSNFIFNKKKYTVQDYSVPLYSILPKTKIVVGISSSVLIESLFYDVIPISYQAFYNGQFALNLNKLKIGLSSKDIKEIKNFLILLMNSQSFYSKYVKNIIKYKFNIFMVKKNNYNSLFIYNLKRILESSNIN
jgi:hypothetical protein